MIAYPPILWQKRFLKSRARNRSFCLIRGGVNSLMAEILEDHIRLHMMTPDRELDSPEELGEDLIGLVRAYLK